MGRKARAVVDRIADGTYQASRHGPPPDDGGEVERLERPKSLEGRAAEVWDEYTALLSGVVRRRDIPVLVELCRWVARSDRIAEALDAMGVDTPAYRALSVTAGIASDKVDKFAARFGANPVDRPKVPQGEGPKAARVPTRPRTKLDEGK